MIIERMGPMKFPILDAAIETGVGSSWAVTRYSYPRNQQEFASLTALIKGHTYSEHKIGDVVREHTPSSSTGSNIIVANAAGNKITVIRGDWSLADLGLEVRQGLEINEDGETVVSVGKEAKRMKAFARPFRIHTRREEGLRVLVMDPGQHPMVYDGASLISEELVLECIGNLSYPVHKYFNYPLIRNYMLEQRIFNGVLLGRLIDIDTGENINKMGKGQYIRCQLPPGVDIVTTPDNLKSEIAGSLHAFVGIEPQGPKTAREDQQTVANHWFFCEPEDCKERLDDEATNNLDHVFSGKFRESVRSLSSLTFRSDDAFTETSFAATQKWRTEAWALHGGSYLWSPWLTQQIANMWVRTLGWRTANWENSLKVRIPCAKRAQVVTESLVNLWRTYEDIEPIEIEHGQLRWDEHLQVGVVSDEDWENIVYASHGGCDLDDFFVIRWVTFEDDYKIIINRSPNARGEYSVWDYVSNDWFPEHKKADGSMISFPFLSTDLAPMQILDALEEGVTSYVQLPSETRERPVYAGQQVYDNTSCLKSVAQVMEVEGGYGQYELAVRALNSVDPFVFDEVAINSESAVDAFAQAGSAEDQRFIISDRDRILERIITNFIAVDSYIGPRLGNNNVLTSVERPISKLKLITRQVIEKYENTVRARLSMLEEPTWLAELGDNNHLPSARKLLRHSRNSMFMANRKVNEVTAPVTRGANEDQNDILAHFFAKIPAGKTRHKYALAFWHACWTTPTSSGKISDQPVFGTGVYDYVLEALIYYGILFEPYVDPNGHVHRKSAMRYDGNHNCVAICTSCNEELTIPTSALDAYWEAQGCCRACRS